MALKVDLEIIRGDSASIGFTLTDAGTAVDLTDATVFFTAKPALTNDVSDNTAVISVEVTDHVDSDGNPSATEGVTTIPLTPTDTNVTPGEYFYDVQIKYSDGTIVSIEPRKMEILADVTRRTT